MPQEKNEPKVTTVQERVAGKPNPWWMFQRPHYVGMEKLPLPQQSAEKENHTSKK